MDTDGRVHYAKARSRQNDHHGHACCIFCQDRSRLGKDDDQDAAVTKVAKLAEDRAAFPFPKKRLLELVYDDHGTLPLSVLTCLLGGRVKGNSPAASQTSTTFMYPNKGRFISALKARLTTSLPQRLRVCRGYCNGRRNRPIDGSPISGNGCKARTGRKPRQPLVAPGQPSAYFQAKPAPSSQSGAASSSTGPAAATAPATTPASRSSVPAPASAPASSFSYATGDPFPLCDTKRAQWTLSGMTSEAGGCAPSGTQITTVSGPTDSTPRVPFPACPRCRGTAP